MSLHGFGGKEINFCSGLVVNASVIRTSFQLILFVIVF